MNGKFLSLIVYCLIWGCSGKPTNVFLSYQDSLGQYSFGYSAPGSARSEVKTLNGATHGAYSYVDENGVIQSIEYIADDDGFHVIATNLPQAPLPVEETAEVSAARKQHLEALRLAEKGGNEEESIVLLKENVQQSEQSQNEKQDGSKTMEELGKMEKGSSIGNQVQTLPEQQSDKENEEEPQSNVEAPTSSEGKTQFEILPKLKFIMSAPYAALIKFPPPGPIHYTPYK